MMDANESQQRAKKIGTYPNPRHSHSYILLTFQDSTLFFILPFVVILFAIFVIKTYVNLKIDARRTQASRTEAKWMEDVEKATLDYNPVIHGEAEVNIADDPNSEK